jgi:hypothetical protein
MRENPAISDWVPYIGGSTEGSLGGWLAQRQAALRGMLAAGARINFPLVYRACRHVLEHFVCHRKVFPGMFERLDIKKGLNQHGALTARVVRARPAGEDLEFQ